MGGSAAAAGREWFGAEGSTQLNMDGQAVPVGHAVTADTYRARVCSPRVGGAIGRDFATTRSRATRSAPGQRCGLGPGVTQVRELVRPGRDEGLQFPIVTMASSTPVSRTGPVRVAATCASSKVGSLTQSHVRAFAFSWSNSAWVMVPASRSCLADAI